MRIYLEAVEQTDDVAEFVRLDITDKTEQEQAGILTALKDYMSGVNAIFSKHYCYHDENKACVAERNI